MKPAFEHVEPTAELSWAGYRARAARYDFTWHFHPELELTLITRGAGTWFVGDTIGEYRAGDLLLTGPDLPHTFVSAPGEPQQDAEVIQFRRDFLGAGLLDSPEFGPLAQLFRRAGRGLLVSDAPWSGQLRSLDRLPPARRTLALLTVLVELAEHPDCRPLATAAPASAPDRAAGRRIDAIINLLHTSYAEPIGLSSVAAVAHMTPSAVSRFFRRTTGSTITGYLNSVRVAAACRLLIDTDRPIAVIAGECGYQNLSHFNRRFLALKAMSPRAYRQRFQDSAGGAADVRIR